MDDPDAGILESGQVVLRIAPRRLHNAHAALDDRIDISRIIGCADAGQKGQIDAEGLVGHVTAAGDFIGKVGR